MYLRAISENRIGGILVPFRVKDKYGNWWDENTDFELDMFTKRPIFWFHRQKGAWERAGYLEDEFFQFLPEGLYGEGPITEDNATTTTIMRYVRANDAQWSTATMPPWWKERPDGYITKWPFIEASVAPARATVSPLGTTTVKHVRALLPNLEIDDSTNLKRSIFIMPPITNNHQTPEATTLQQAVDAFHSVADQIETISQELGSLRTEIEDLRDQPRKKLPDPEDNPQTPPPDIQVFNKYDQLEPFALALYHRAMRSEGRNAQALDETFMRAMLHGIEKQYNQQEDEIARRGAERTMPLIDEEAYNAIHKRVPYLRANEAMGSTLVGFGDEMVPTILSSMWWRKIFLATKVAQQFPIFDMPSNPYEMTTIGLPTIRFVPELTDKAQLTVSNSPIPTSKPATSKTTWTALKWGSLVPLSEELFEESHIDAIAALAENTTTANAQALDELIISADESATEDLTISWYDVGALAILGQDADKLLAMDGLRRIAWDAGDKQDIAAAFSLAKLTVVEKLMGPRGIYGIDPRETVLIVDPGVYRQIRDLTEYQSMADVGEHATLVSGMIGAVQGRPIILSDQLEYVDSAGKIPKNNAGTLGSFILAHRRMNRIGKLRNVTIESDKVLGAEGRWLASTARADIQSMQTGSVGYGFNVTGV